MQLEGLATDDIPDGGLEGQETFKEEEISDSKQEVNVSVTSKSLETDKKHISSSTDPGGQQHLQIPTEQATAE